MRIESLPKAGAELMRIGRLEKSFDLGCQITLGRVNGPSPILKMKHAVGLVGSERKNQKILRRWQSQSNRERAIGDHNVGRCSRNNRDPKPGNGRAVLSGNFSGHLQLARAHGSKTEIELAGEKGKILASLDRSIRAKKFLL